VRSATNCHAVSVIERKRKGRVIIRGPSIDDDSSVLPN
jgi:hypothetical protein